MSKRNTRTRTLVMAAASVWLGNDTTSAFTTSSFITTRRHTHLNAGLPELDAEIEQRLARAKALLEKSKAKIEKDDDNDDDTEADSSLPFFASAQKIPCSREGVIKSRNEETGLIRADGERMAAISEEEEWERKSLLEVFENEIDENEDVYSLASQQLASRDVAASVWDLRKSLQGNDYQKIFDKKNRFIGEDN